MAGAPSSSLSQAILKLIEVIEDENATLRNRQIITHAGFTDRKNQALRELMAAQRSEPPHRSAASVRHLLQQLSAALHINGDLLKLHISAVGELSDIIIGGLRDADSDGTYSRSRHTRV